MRIRIPIYLPKVLAGFLPSLLRLIRYLGIRYLYLRLICLTRKHRSLYRALRAMGFRLFEPNVFKSKNDLAVITFVRTEKGHVDIRVGMSIIADYAPVEE